MSSVAVSNGFINNMTNQAIIVGDGSTLITLKDLEISGVGELSNVFAVDFQGSTTRITDCLLQNITIAMAAGGIQLSSVDSTKVVDCRIVDCSVPNFLNAIAVTGFNGSGIPCTANEIINCRAERLDSPQGVTALFFIVDQGTVVDQTYVCSLSSSAGPVIAMQSSGSEELLIKNCSIAVLSSSLQAQGIFLFGVGQSIIQDCTIAGVYIDNPQPLSYANAIEVVGIQGSIKNVVIADIGLDINMASTSVGIFLNPASSNFVVQNCTVVDVSGSDQALGFQIESSNTILEECQANSVAADTNACGFLLGPLTNCTISDCTALSISVTGLGTGMSAGFNLQIDNGILTDCTAQAILSSDPTSTAYGFVTLVGTNSLILDRCIANDISGGVQGVGFELDGLFTYLKDSQANGATSIGIDIPVTATLCIVENCRATNAAIGINNAITAATIFDSFASNNGQNYAGVGNLVALGAPTLAGENIDTTLTTTFAGCFLITITAPMTITQAGSYCLTTSLEGAIIITTSNVDVDLRGFTISNTMNGIIINQGMSNVTVSNGSITNMTDQAIIVGDSARLITLKDLEITQVSTNTTSGNVNAIEFQIPSGFPRGINDCLIKNVTITKSQTGMLLLNTSNTQIIDCRILDCSSNAVDIAGLILTSSASAGHINIGACFGNQIINCNVESISSLSMSATGIVLVNGENTLISQSSVSNITARNYAVGIELLFPGDVIIDNCSTANLFGQFYVIGIESSFGQQVTVDNCMVAELIATDTGIGFSFNGSFGCVLKNSVVSGIGPQLSPISGVLSAGVLVVESADLLIENVTVLELGTTNSCVGFSTDSASSGVIFQNCSCIGISGGGTNGFSIASNDTSLQGCKGNEISGNINNLGNSAAAGFLLDNSGTAIINASLIDCSVLNVSTNTNNQPNGLGSGFMLHVQKGFVQNCLAQEIVSTDPTSTAYGFVTLVSTSSLLIDQCTANDITAGYQAMGFNLDGEFTYLRNSQVNGVEGTLVAVGIDIPVTTTACIVENCRATNVMGGIVGRGINNQGPASRVFDCFASFNKANYFGVPNVVIFGAPTITGQNISA